MSKALVIKGANFSANKVETITLSNPVHCTGITLSQVSMSATNLGTIGTLTATLTPSDTTDQVTWVSSDETVATVANGVVTAVGIGSATITAICGTQSAECSVSLTEVELSVNDFAVALHKIASQNATDFENGKDYISPYGIDADTYKKYAILMEDDATDYKALTTTDTTYDAMYPIVIPKNAAHITVQSSGLYGATPIYMDSSAQPTYSISGKGTKVVAHGATAYVSSGVVSIDIPQNIPGLDSCCLVLRFSGTIEALPSGTVVTFSA